MTIGAAAAVDLDAVDADLEGSLADWRRFRSRKHLVEVHWVAALPEVRGRGFGGAVTSAAVAVAPELPALLISSDDGHPVYRRLGFWDLFRTTMWEHPPR